MIHLHGLNAVSSPVDGQAGHRDMPMSGFADATDKGQRMFQERIDGRIKSTATSFANINRSGENAYHG